jgi:hypothetical protein
VRSLTPHEKRYFKIFATRHVMEKNNFQIKLFDAIESQEIYDEEALVRKFKNETFAKRFSVAKSRLYETILKSLHAYHSGSSVDAELKKMLHMAEILYKKTLYRQCDKILRKAKKLALEHDKHTTLLEIRLWEKRIIEKDNYSGQDDKAIKEILNQDLNTIDLIQNYYTFWNLKSRFFLPLYKGGKVRNLEEKEKFNKILKHPLLQDERNAKTVEAKYLYHHIFSAHFFSVGDYENSYKHMILNLDLIEKNWVLFKEEPNTYTSIMANVIYIGNQLGKNEEVDQYFVKLHDFTSKIENRDNVDLQMRIFSSLKSLELTILVQKGEYDRAVALVPEILEGMDRYGSKLSPLRIADFYFNLAILYFGLEEFSAALKFINKILNESKIDENEDLFSFSRFMSLILHHELEHHELVIYQSESTYRYLRKRNRVFKTERSLIKFFKKLHQYDPSDVKPFVDLRNELIQLSSEPLERPTLEYFDFVSWTESKIEKKSFGEIVRRKQNGSSKMAS